VSGRRQRRCVTKELLETQLLKTKNAALEAPRFSLWVVPIR
jgi:hypothetical protein